MQSDCAFSKERMGAPLPPPHILVAVYHIRYNSTPHREFIFPQGQRTPTLGTSNNIHTAVNSAKALGTHGFRLSAHTGRAKQMEGKRSDREEAFVVLQTPNILQTLGEFHQSPLVFPSNGIRQAFCMPTAAVTNASHPVTADCSHSSKLSCLTERSVPMPRNK